MALQPCTECGAQISDKAVACPQCGAAPDKPKKTRWWLLILIGIFAALIAIAFIAGSSPEVQLRVTDREKIDFCWTQQKRPSQTPSEARFIAGACEKMEEDFRERHGRNP